MTPFESKFNTAFLLTCTFVTLFPLSQQAEVPCAPVKTRACPLVDPKASLVGAYIEGCFEEPCTFYKGQNITFEMDIDFKQNVTKLEARLFALLGAEIGWDGINPNACEDIVSEGECPFHAGDYITYGVNLYVSPGYPTVTVDVKFMLLDENQDVQLCWIVKVAVRGTES